MFNQSFEDLLTRKLDAVSDEFDKREGSVIYNALAPNSLEVQQLYMMLSWAYEQLDPQTADFANLIRWASPFGIVPRVAEPAQIIAEFDAPVPIGTRFNWNDVNFVVVNADKKELVAENAGLTTIKQGDLLAPIDAINDLTISRVKEVILLGRDAESHDDFLLRTQKDINRQAYGGNIADYERMTESIVGVGAVVVKRAYKGAGTVGLVIVDSDYNSPSAELVRRVQEQIDPVGNSGEGIGLAPIDHRVTVLGASKDTVNITLNLTYASSHSWESAQSAIKETIESYFKEVRKSWKDGRLIIYISQIESRLLKLDSIVDISHTKINGLEENHIVAVDSVPVLGSVGV